jgi:uncharacterized protein
MKPLMIVREIYEAFADGDIASILDVLADGVTWEVAGSQDDYPIFGRRRGRSGALEFFLLLAEHEDLSHFAPERFHATSEAVVVEGRAELLLRKTGRPVAYEWVHVWTFAGRKVSGFRAFYDTAAVIEAYRAPAIAA